MTAPAPIVAPVAHDGLERLLVRLGRRQPVGAVGRRRAG